MCVLSPPRTWFVVVCGGVWRFVVDGGYGQASLHGDTRNSFMLSANMTATSISHADLTKPDVVVPTASSKIAVEAAMPGNSVTIVVV